LWHGLQAYSELEAPLQSNYRPHTLILLFLLLYSLSNFAIVSPIRFEKKALPPQICAIVSIVEGAAGTQKISGCTGTVVGNDKLLTAAHCFPKEKHYSLIYCQESVSGTDTINSPTAKVINSSINGYVPLGEREDKQFLPLNDLAIVTSDRNLGIVPLKVSGDSRNQIENILDLKNEGKNENCALFGYGQGWEAKNKGLYKYSGGLVGYEKVHDSSFSRNGAYLSGRRKILENILTLGVQYFGTSSFSIINQGDSGGPLICRDKKGEWKIVGVHSASFPVLMSFITLIFDKKDWIAEEIRK
jgi:Trypsin